MPATLLDLIRAATLELKDALRHASDPSFDVRTLDLALMQRLQRAVGDVARATEEASAGERERARSDPAYRAYLEVLARLGASVDSWNDGLLAYRAKLDRDGEHLRAARSWAEAYNRTR